MLNIPVTWNTERNPTPKRPTLSTSVSFLLFSILPKCFQSSSLNVASLYASNAGSLETDSALDTSDYPLGALLCQDKISQQ